MNKNKYVSVDVEADGAYPGDYSMISFGAVIVDGEYNKTFYGLIHPISEKWNPEALAVSGFSREETLNFYDPVEVMESFEMWLKDNVGEKPIFVSDNNGFDFAFIN